MCEDQIINEESSSLVTGEAIRDDSGIVCYPAIDPVTEEKLMIKTIRIPADPEQGKALLYSGACADEDQLAEYYEEKVQQILDQTDLLLKLSDEGFIPFRQVTMKKDPDSIVHTITLVNDYLDTPLARPDDPNWTHRSALSLGIRLCDILTGCREQGYLYTNLRLENLFVDANGDCCICDLGFVPLDAISYTAFPRHHKTIYAPPELDTAYASMDLTLDSYEIGLLLYQIYNGGVMPDKNAITPPDNADYLLWSILESACNTDPSQRFTSPQALGQALTEYMAQCTVLDQPVVYIHPTAQIEDEKPVLFLSEDENDALLSNKLLLLADEQEPADLMDVETSDIEANAPDDLADMLAKADDLINHELPQPVVAPTPGDFSIVMPAAEETPEEIAPVIEEEVPVILPEPPVIEEIADPEPVSSPEPKKSKKGLVITLSFIAAVLVVLAAVMGIGYYNHIYIQTVDAITVSATDQSAQITIDADIDNSLLTAVCTDTYGNTVRSKFYNGVAIIEELNPNTHYRVEIQISGNHKLTGQIRTSFTTNAQTQVQNFSAICGQLSGSAVLSFSVTGQNDNWTLYYSTQGEPERTVSFTGTTVTVNALRIGKEYTFRLCAPEDIILVGQTELKYTAQTVVVAQNIRPVAFGNSSVTVKWDSADENIRWQVRCYNGSDYDNTITVTGTEATFDGINFSNGYTILVTAEGMSRSESVSITADSIRLMDPVFTESKKELLVSWTFVGTAPESGWTVTYTVNDGAPVTIQSDEPSVKLSLTKGGAYSFTVNANTDRTVFSQDWLYQAT